MSDCVQKTEEFLRRRGIDPSTVDMEHLLNTFLSEMEKGLIDEYSSSLKMIPTYTAVVSEIPKNEPVIVLDAGGTNFRTCLVTFDDQGDCPYRGFQESINAGC